MEFVNLESISTKIDYGLTESATEQDTGHKFLRITDIREGKIKWSGVPYCECSETDAKKYELHDGDIVFARTGSVGNTCLIKNDAPEGSVFASYLIRIRPNKEIIHPEYLSYYFQTPNYWRQIEVGSVGAIQGGLNATKLSELEIPLPPLTEQKRIASLLRRADRLRQLRRTAHDLSASVLQSVFLEMFMDPIESTGNWDREPLIDVINPDRPITYGILMPGENLPNGVPYVRVVDIRNGKIDVENVRRTSEAIDKQYKRSRLLPEDLLLTIRGQVGRLAIVPPQLSGANITQDTARLAPIKSKCNVYFLYGYFLLPSVQRLMQSLTRGVAVTGINLGDVKELPIPIPPLSLQEEFAGVVRRVEGLRGRMSEAGRQIEGLFESLLSESFGG